MSPLCSTPLGGARPSGGNDERRTVVETIHFIFSPQFYGLPPPKSGLPQWPLSERVTIKGDNILASY